MRDLRSRERSDNHRWRAVIDAICVDTGLRLSPVGSLALGESGALRVQDQQGNTFVLKTHPNPDRASQYEYATAVTQALREIGYPVPRHITSGSFDEGAWQLIEWIPGNSHLPLTDRTLAQMVALVEQHRNRAIHPDPYWIDEIVDSVLNGCTGYCEVKSLQEHSDRTRQLLLTIQTWASLAHGSSVSTSDIVHFDFHPGNILVADDSVTAVIDWEGVCSGDATFDLVTLLFYCYDETPHGRGLLETIRKQTVNHVFRLYMAHMIVRQVDWSIRFHDAEAVDYFLSRSERIVQEIGSLR